MPKRIGDVTIKGKWKIEDPKIYHANVFQIFFTPFSSVLYLGFIDPEALLPKPKPKPKTVEEKITDINLLARYSLDMEAFMRLKNEIDKAYIKLKEMGALKNDK